MHDIDPLLIYLKDFIELEHNEVELIRKMSVRRKYLKNQFILQQGDVCRHLNFVIKGCTRTYVVDINGLEHIILFSIEKWWTSDLGSFVSQTPADFNIQCMEPTEVIQFGCEELHQLYEKIPKLDKFFRMLLEKALVSSQKRIIRNFSLTAKDQYLAFKKLYPEMERRIPQYMIASYLGITKEFLSKIKSQLILEQ
ncbi:MAG: Crp/Fnr family transcriptional regulator [Flavobacteriaceae bacterium]|nr:Crp/Fnr family transcriptional regulator [Flavobacteriaceae bacterium]